MQYASLSTSQLKAWAILNNVELRGVKVEPDILDEDGHEKGGGLIATADHTEAEPLLIVPSDMIISRERIAECCKVDVKLRDLMEALDETELIKTSRGMILVFLLYQLTIASPEQGGGTGVQSSFTDYVKILPKEIPLPTFYSDEERDMLVGTSLNEALGQKIRGLEREFEMLGSRTRGLGWCRTVWWGLSPEEDEDDVEEADEGPLRFEHWALADAMYRSRALELPQGKGIVMVPVLDMANHAPDDQYNARFEVDGEGNVELVVRDKKTIETGQEITIMYGCGGACEMIFSYGFLDLNISSAREMFLSLSIPSDDPLRMAKMRFSEDAPGVRLYVDQAGKVGWESDFVWWACANEEDGLDFQVLQSNDGQKELRAVWKGREFEASELKKLLFEDELRDIFVLRSLVLIQQQVEQQGRKIGDSEATFEQARDATGVRETTWQLVSKLRELELEMLTRAFEALEARKAALLGSGTVRRFLGSSCEDGAGEEDFS